jgi:hypothetical protein
MARELRLGPIRARLGRARVRRSGRGLVGLAPRLGLERFRLGMGSGRLGLGWSAGWCVVWCDRRSAADRRATADLHRAAAGRRRASRDLPTADRCRPTARVRSFRVGPAAADRPAARRRNPTADRGPAAACYRRCGGAAVRHLRAARLRAVFRSSRPGLRDHRTRLVERWLHHRRRRGTRGGSSDRSFQPSRVWVHRGVGRLSRSGARAVPRGTSLGRALARGSRGARFWRLARRRLRRLARRWRRLA